MKLSEYLSKWTQNGNGGFQDFPSRNITAEKIRTFSGDIFRVFHRQLDPSELDSDDNLRIGYTIDGDFTGIERGYVLTSDNFYWRYHNRGDLVLSINESNITIGTVSKIGYETNPDYNLIGPNELVSKGHLEDLIGTTFYNITFSEFQNLVNLSELVPGALYMINGVDVSLYGGTTIWTRAISTNRVEPRCTGRFYNPPYDKNSPNYGIWDPGMPSPNIDDRIIWGGRIWRNLNGNIGNSIDLFSLDSEWEIITDTNEYVTFYDQCVYDQDTDEIIYREEISSGNRVWKGRLNLNYNNILYFQWGNGWDNNYTYKGIGNCIIETNSLFFCINNKLASVKNIKLVNQSHINLLGGNGQLENSTFSDNSYFEATINGNINKMQLVGSELGVGTIGFNLEKYTQIHYNRDLTIEPVLNNEINQYLVG